MAVRYNSRQKKAAATYESQPAESHQGVGPAIIGANSSPGQVHLMSSSALALLARGPPKARAKAEATWPTSKLKRLRDGVAPSQFETRLSQNESIIDGDDDSFVVKRSNCLMICVDPAISTLNEDIAVDDGPGKMNVQQPYSDITTSIMSAQKNTSGSCCDHGVSISNDRLTIQRPIGSKSDENDSTGNNNSHGRSALAEEIPRPFSETSSYKSSALLSDSGNTTVVSIPDINKHSIITSDNPTPPLSKLRSSPPESPVLMMTQGRPGSPRDWAATSSDFLNSTTALPRLPKSHETSMFDNRRMQGSASASLAGQQHQAGCSDRTAGHRWPRRSSYSSSFPTTGNVDISHHENIPQITRRHQPDKGIALPEVSHVFLPSLRFQQHVSSVKNVSWKPGKARFAGLTTSQEYASLVRVMTEQDIHAIRKKGKRPACDSPSNNEENGDSQRRYILRSGGWHLGTCPRNPEHGLVIMRPRQQDPRLLPGSAAGSKTAGPSTSDQIRTGHVDDPRTAVRHIEQQQSPVLQQHWVEEGNVEWHLWRIHCNELGHAGMDKTWFEVQRQLYGCTQEMCRAYVVSCGCAAEKKSRRAGRK